MPRTTISTQLTVDSALSMDANYKFTAADRRYIDDQIRAIEQHLVDNLINGKLATWFTLSGASAAVIAGDTVCLASVPGLVTKSTAVALSASRAALGVVARAASPGGKVLVVVGGVLSPSFTGLASGTTAFVRVNTTTSRLEAVDSYTSGDFAMGSVDATGWMQVTPGSMASAGAGGGSTANDETWAPSGAPNTEIISSVRDFAHDGAPADQEGLRLALPNGFSTDHRVIVQCAGPNDEYFREELRGAWMRAGSYVLEKDTPGSSGDATGNQAGYGAVLARDGTDAVVTLTGEGNWSIIVTRVRTTNGLNPIITGLVPAFGDPAGGSSIILSGARLAAGAQVTVGGSDATAENVTDQNTMTFVTPAHAAGTVNVVITNPDTKTATLVGGFVYASAFDPLSLSPTVWAKGSFTGVPWVDQSGNGRNFTTSLFDPVAGPAVNGYTPADFTPLNYLAQTTNNNVLLSASASSIWILFYSDLSATESGFNYQDANLFCDQNAETGVGIVKVGGVPKLEACFYSGAFIRVELATTDGAWHLAQIKHDGVNLKIRIDGGAWSSVACGALSFLSPGPCKVGTSYGNACQFDGRILEVGVCNTVVSDADFDNLRAYCGSRYGVSV